MGIKLRKSKNSLSINCHIFIWQWAEHNGKPELKTINELPNTLWFEPLSQREQSNLWATLVNNACEIPNFWRLQVHLSFHIIKGSTLSSICIICSFLGQNILLTTNIQNQDSQYLRSINKIPQKFASGRSWWICFCLSQSRCQLPGDQFVLDQPHTSQEGLWPLSNWKSKPKC